MTKKRHWAVTVRVDGEEVLTIESECYGGVGNVTNYREEIVTAADHLVAFVGREDGPYFDFPPEPQLQHYTPGDGGQRDD